MTESKARFPELQLSVTEARVLGCLMEKEATTPAYYPLTLNSLQAACNQIRIDQVLGMVSALRCCGKRPLP